MSVILVLEITNAMKQAGGVEDALSRVSGFARSEGVEDDGEAREQQSEQCE